MGESFMIKIIVGIVFLIFSGTCILFSHLINKLNGSKQSNRIYTTGIIDGYVDTEGLLYTPYVKLIDQNGIEHIKIAYFNNKRLKRG